MIMFGIILIGIGVFIGFLLGLYVAGIASDFDRTDLGNIRPPERLTDVDDYGQRRTEE